MFIEQFESTEKECFVLSDGTPETYPCLHPREWRLLVVKKIPSLQTFMPEESKQFTMKLIGTGFRHDVDYAAGSAAELGRVVAAVDLKLLHGRLRDRRPDSSGVVDVARPVNADVIPTAVTAGK